MPNIKSAKKRERQNISKREVNRQKKSTLRTSEKKFRTFLEEKNFEEAKKVLTSFFSIMDRAAKTSLFHKNTANRKKSRLAKALKAAQA